MRVVHLAEYCTAGCPNGVNECFGGLSLVKDLKQEVKRVAGEFPYADQFGQKHKHIGKSTDSAHLAFGILGRQALINELKTKQDLLLIPVPSSKCTSTNHIASTTSRMCTNLKQQLGLLGWNVEVPQLPPVIFFDAAKAAHTGGSRDAESLFSNMYLTGKTPSTTRTVVLVDDVLTLGGHLQATAAILRQFGVKNLLGICAAKTAHGAPEGGWRFPNFSVTELEDWQPSAIAKKAQTARIVALNAAIVASQKVVAKVK